MTAAITEPDAAETAPDCLVEQDGHVLIVTMNRPHRRNALSSEMLRIMESAWDRVNEDPEIRVCILTGAGGYFCAGMDLKGFLTGDLPVVEGRGFAGVAEAPPRKPLIAAVNGHALAGGFELVLACDLVVSVDGVKFGIPEVKRGLAGRDEKIAFLQTVIRAMGAAGIPIMAYNFKLIVSKYLRSAAVYDLFMAR